VTSENLPPSPNGDDDRAVADSDPDKEKGEGQRLPPIEAEVLTDDEREEFAQDVSRRIMMSTSWSGRLPRPEDLEKYNAIVPGAAEKLVEDVVFDTQLAQQSIEIDKAVSAAIIEIMRGNHNLETEESRSD
jgi:hypothetical protein